MKRPLVVLALLLVPLVGAQEQSEEECPSIYPPDVCSTGVGVSPAPPQPLTLGDLACWNLNEASGTRADSCGTNNLADPATIDVVTGVSGNGVQESFGAADCLTGTLVSLGDEWTVAWWMSNAPDEFSEVAWINGEMKVEGGILPDFGGNGTFLDIDGGGGCQFGEGPPGWNPNSSTFYLYIVWRDATAQRVYCQIADQAGNFGGIIEGVSLAMPTLTGSFSIGPCAVGFFSPPMDEMGFWDRQLSEANREELVTNFPPY